MKRYLFFVVVAWLVVGSCILVEAAEPSASNNTDNEFAGKIVQVHTATGAYTLENVKLIRVGGQSFLSGTGVKRTKDESQREQPTVFRRDWWQGLPLRVNVSFVVAYCPMTPEQWNALMASPSPVPARKESRP